MSAATGPAVGPSRPGPLIGFLRALARLALLRGLLLGALGVLPCALPCGAAPLFTIQVPLEPGRQVRVLFPWGESRQVGQVVSIPRATVFPAFDASKWGRPGCVTAVGVNVIHLLLDVENGRGRMISLLPTHTIAPAARPAGAVLIEATGGSGLFGAWAPPVGTPVTAIDEKGARSPLSTESLKTAKVLEISVPARADCPYYVDIENRLEGQVSVVWPDRTEVVAKVVHPVTGVGGFEGSQFQDTGRLRANHPGVVCFSTTPAGEMGGFQIIPLVHAKSEFMRMSWTEPEWMILEPVIPERSSPGREPLFSGFLVPGPNPRDGAEAVWEKIVRIPYLMVRIDGGDWVPLPEVRERDNGPGCILRRVTHLRIVYPFLLSPPPTPVPTATPVPTVGPTPRPSGPTPRPTGGAKPSPTPVLSSGGGSPAGHPTPHPTAPATPRPTGPGGGAPSPTPKPTPRPTGVPRPSSTPHPTAPATPRPSPTPRPPVPPEVPPPPEGEAPIIVAPGF